MMPSKAKENIALREMALSFTRDAGGHYYIKCDTRGLFNLFNFAEQYGRSRVKISSQFIRALSEFRVSLDSDRDLHITSAVMPVHDSKVMYRRPTIYLDGSPICILQDFQPVDAFYRENRLIAMSSEKGMGLDGNHTITLTLSYAEVAKLNSGEPIMVNPVGTGGRNPRKAA